MDSLKMWRISFSSYQTFFKIVVLVSYIFTYHTWKKVGILANWLPSLRGSKTTQRDKKRRKIAKISPKSKGKCVYFFGLNFFPGMITIYSISLSNRYESRKVWKIILLVILSTHEIKCLYEHESCFLGGLALHKKTLM